jgi:hypothetical protein
VLTLFKLLLCLISIISIGFLAMMIVVWFHARKNDKTRPIFLDAYRSCATGSLHFATISALIMAEFSFNISKLHDHFSMFGISLYWVALGLLLALILIELALISRRLPALRRFLNYRFIAMLSLGANLLGIYVLSTVR